MFIKIDENLYVNKNSIDAIFYEAAIEKTYIYFKGASVWTKKTLVEVANIINGEIVVA